MTKEDFFLDVVNANRRGQAVMIVVEHPEGVDIITNSDRTDFISMMPTFMDIPWKGRVPADQVWGEWACFYVFSLPKQPLPYRDDMDGKAVDIDIVLFIKSHNLGYFQWVELVESDKSLHLPLPCAFF